MKPWRDEYIGLKAAMAIVEKQVVSQQEEAKRDYEKTQKLIDQAFIERDTEEAVFRAQSEDAFKLDFNWAKTIQSSCGQDRISYCQSDKGRSVCSESRSENY